MAEVELFDSMFIEIFSVVNSGALAPEWLFWNSLWRQKMFGAGRKILKNKLFPVLVLKNLGKTLELEIWEKLSHKNAIKMAWWVIFNFLPKRKILKLWRL